MAGTKAARGVQNQTTKALALILNPAPIKRDSTDVEGVNHRGNTPWVIHYPQIGVTVQPLDTNGEPYVGFWNDKDAGRTAEIMWDVIRETAPEKWSDLSIPFPELQEGFKMMFRFLIVRPL